MSQMKNSTQPSIFKLTDLNSTAAMKTKIATYAFIVLAISGCSTTTKSRMDTVDLNYFKIDCSRKDEQLAFVKAQIPSTFERQMNGLAMTSIFGWANSAYNGTFDEDRAMLNGQQAGIARSIIQQLNTHCPDITTVKKTQGCVAVNENTSAGASSGSRCQPAGNSKPITRWEAMVDN